MDPKNNPRRWYSLAAKDEAAELLIYDIIDDWGVSAKAFLEDLQSVKDKPINLRLNSPGGVVVAGFAIYNALKRHPHPVNVYVDGLAASIASLVAMAGQTIHMAEASLLMVHNPWSYGCGDSDDLRKQADLLDQMADMMAAIYAEKSGQTPAQIRAIMDAETWYTAEEAKEAGFCDVITEPIKAAAMLRQHDLSAFRHPPAAALPNTTKHNTKTETIPAPVANLHKEGTMPEPNTATPTPPAQPTGAASASVQPGKREAEIVELAVAHKMTERASEWILSGKSPDQISREILAALAKAPLATPASKPDIDLGKQAKEYSFARAIRAAIGMSSGATPSGFEVDIHQELLRLAPANAQQHNGILVPFAMGKQYGTALTTDGTGTGKELVTTQYGDLIPMLQKKSFATRLGAQILTGLQGTLTFPKQTSSGTFYWNGENPGVAVTESNIGTGVVTMSPKSGSARNTISRQLVYQNSYDAEGMVRNDLTRIAALAWDRAVAHGAGASNEPDGLYHLSGVNSYAMGGVPSNGKLIDMTTEVALDDAMMENTGFVTTPGMAGKLMQTQIVSGQSAMIWTGTHIEGQVCGYRAIATNQISKTLGAGSEYGLLFGSWSEVLIGMWTGGAEIFVDPYSLADQAMIKIIVYLMMDVFVRYPMAFCKATGATIA